MSIEKILKDTNCLTPSTKLVLVTLLSFSQENGSCSPTIRKLAGLTGLTGTTIRRAIKELVKYDYISINERFHEDGGQLSNEYIINRERGII